LESENSSFSEVFANSLRNTVVSTLHRKGYSHHRALEITVDQGTVIVDGVVPAWHLRQIAMECIRRVPGVARVVDRIRVLTESPDKNRPSVSAAVIQPGTELDARESKAGRTICVPVSEGTASRVSLIQDSSEISVDRLQNSPDPWFGPRNEASDKDRQLQTVYS